MDPRLRTAIDASVGWYEDLFALHGVGSSLAGGLLRALAPPPPLHSNVVVVEPSVTVGQVLGALEGVEHGGFKDSFATLDMAGSGMELLFEATWLHREPAPPPPSADDSGWRAVTTAEELARWTGGHDTSALLLPSLLERGHFRILAKYDGADIVAGAVARLGSGAVDVSNVHAAEGQAVDWAELATAIASVFPARPLVGYERDGDLEAARSAGFAPVGELRVWVR